jgi:hypothetical protein
VLLAEVTWVADCASAGAAAANPTTATANPAANRNPRQQRIAGESAEPREGARTDVFATVAGLGVTRLAVKLRCIFCFLKKDR